MGFYEAGSTPGSQVEMSYKVETPIHDNDLILTPIIAPQSG